MAWPLTRWLEQASPQWAHRVLCPRQQSFPMAWFLPQTLWPTVHTALEGSQIYPRSFARHGVSWDTAEATTLPEMEACLQGGMTKKLMRIMRAEFGHLYDAGEMLEVPWPSCLYCSSEESCHPKMDWVLGRHLAAPLHGFRRCWALLEIWLQPCTLRASED